MEEFKMEVKSFMINPQSNWPIKNQKGNFSGIECQIDLKPGCRLKFFHYLRAGLEKVVEFSTKRKTPPQMKKN